MPFPKKASRSGGGPKRTTKRVAPSAPMPVPVGGPPIPPLDPSMVPVPGVAPVGPPPGPPMPGMPGMPVGRAIKGLR